MCKYVKLARDVTHTSPCRGDVEMVEIQEVCLARHFDIIDTNVVLTVELVEVEENITKVSFLVVFIQFFKGCSCSLPL